jgi:tetratricopeptide (TPR) repeat protein
VLLALIASTVIARREQTIAEKRFQDLRRFANFTLNDLDLAMRAGMTPARKKVVAKGVEYLDALAAEARNDPSIQHDLINGYLKMGDVQGNPYMASLGDSKGAEQSYRKALDVAQARVRIQPRDPEARRDVAAAHVKLGDVLGPNGKKKEALDKYAQARKVYEDLLAQQPANPMYLRNLTLVWDKIGGTHDQMWDAAGALESYRRCTEIAKAWFAVDANRARERLAFAQERVAYFAALSGETAGGEESIQEALRTYQSSSDPSERNIAQVYATMAEIQKRSGKIPAALESARKSLRITENLLANDPENSQYQTDLPQSLVPYIDLLIRSGKKAEAHQQTARALTFLKPRVEAPNASLQNVENYALLLATTEFSDLRDDKAALRWARKAVIDTDQSDPEAMDYLAQAFARNSDFTNAVAVGGKALALLPAADPVRGPSDLRKTIEGHLAAFQTRGRPLTASSPH